MKFVIKNKLFLFVLILFFINFISSECDEFNLGSCGEEDLETLKIIDSSLLIDSLTDKNIEDKKYLIGEINRRIYDESLSQEFLESFNSYSSRESRNFWWKYHGYKSENTQIETFDGKIVKTKGPLSTTFNINEHLGGMVDEEGCLISNFFKGCGTIIEIDNKTGIFNIKEGFVFITNLTNFDKSLNILGNAKIDLKDKIYSSDKSLVLSSINEIPSFKGEKILEKDSNGNLISEFSGELSINSDHLKLGDKTSYSAYKNNELSKIFEVEKSTNYYPEKDCLGQNTDASCIGYSEDFVKVYSKDNNKIKIKDFENNNFYIDKITDSSQINFLTQETEFVFSKNPPILKGNFANLVPKVYSNFLDSKGKEHQLRIENGKITQCSFPCTDFSISSIVQPRIAELSKDSKFLEEMKSKYGNQVKSGYLNYLVVNGNPGVYKSALTASQQLYERKEIYISPEFLYTGAVAEGLGDLIVDRAKRDINNIPEINGFHYLGLDSFGENAQILRAKGYLPSDFTEREDYFEWTRQGNVQKGGKYLTEQKKSRV